MNEDFKTAIILLMQHPIMHKSISKLTDDQCSQAYDLIKQLITYSVEDDYTQLDYIQMARLEYYLGELAFRLNDESTTAMKHYKSASHLLGKGGFDLSLQKWVQLVSLRIKE